MDKKTIELFSLAEGKTCAHVISNQLGIVGLTYMEDLLREAKAKKFSLYVRNIFANLNPFQTGITECREIIDTGLHVLRSIKKSRIDICFEDSQSMECDMNVIKGISPPLYEWCKTKIETFKSH